MSTANPYDAFPYEALPIRASHPERLVIVSGLNGGPQPATRGARIFEAGCANGANILPLAFYDPQATVIGVDYSPTQIETAELAAERLGLDNLRLEQRDLLHGAPDVGELDFIIAHGFYSWVPVPVRQAFFELCRAQLSADGLIYVSYNTFPGWRMRGLIRDLLLRTVGDIPEAKTRGEQAQALAHTLKTLLPPTADHPYGELLALELGGVVDNDLSSILHDHMEADLNPVGLADFVAEIEGYGLHYLGELPPGPREAARLDGVRGALRSQGLDGIELEKTVDLLAYRQLRTSVLCRREAAGSGDPARALVAAHVSADLMPTAEEPDLAPGVPEVFETSQGLKLRFDEPFLKAVLVALDEVAPAALPLAELGERVAALGETANAAETTEALRLQLPRLYELGLIDLTTSAGAEPSAPSLCAHPLARYEASQGGTLTSRAHTLLPLDELDRLVIERLDGSRDRAALLAALVETLASGEPAVEIDGRPLTEPEELTPLVEELLDQALETLADWGMLTAAESTP